MSNHKLYKIITVGFLTFSASLGSAYFFLNNTSEKTYPWDIVDNYKQVYDCDANPINLKSCETPIKVFVECQAEYMEICTPLHPWINFDQRFEILSSYDEANLALRVDLKSRIHPVTKNPFIHGYTAYITKGAREHYKDGYGVGGGGMSAHGNYIPWNMEKLLNALNKGLIGVGEIQ